jgi:hypothetical protein
MRCTDQTTGELRARDYKSAISRRFIAQALRTTDEMGGMSSRDEMAILAHLVDRRVISARQANEALEVQRKARPPIGELAVRNRIITVKQVFEVMRVQIDSRERFGEIAVGLGYMKLMDLERLLVMQKAETPALGSILVQMGALSAQALAAESARASKPPPSRRV